MVRKRLRKLSGDRSGGLAGNCGSESRLKNNSRNDGGAGKKESGVSSER